MASDLVNGRSPLASRLRGFVKSIYTIRIIRGYCLRM
jgi:hypothetical protein